MLERFASYIQSLQLLSKDSKVLLAVSGGIDSVVLAHLFSRTSYQFAIAHCNFKLRGEESDAEEVFVRELAQELKVPFYVEVFQTKELIQDHNISTQMMARELRYGWFESLLLEKNYNYVATGHHLNDSIETLWLNLIRGTSIAGLHGILPQNESVIRPLLFATRDEIHQYALENQLNWREDSSNQENYYRRNLIRNEVFPLFKKINPNVEATTQRNIERFRAIEVIFKESIDELRGEVMSRKGYDLYLDFRKLEQYTEPLIRLYYLLESWGFNYDQCKDIWKAKDSISGKTFYSSSNYLIKDRDHFIISPVLKNVQIDIDIHPKNPGFQIQGFKFLFEELIFTNDFQIEKDASMAFLDRDKLKFPLKLRNWQEGDFFYPLGMKHRQKISDFLINQKIPLPQKERVLVLCSTKDIVWVIGYRIDDRFKIASDTKHVLKIKKTSR